IRFRFRLVHRGVGGGIDHNLRLSLMHPLANRVAAGQVNVRKIHASYLGQRSQGAAQFPADLADFSDEQEAGLGHGNNRSPGTSESRGAFASRSESSGFSMGHTMP